MTAAATQAPVQAAHEPVLLDAQDLPLHCPGPKAALWSLHPRVFLDVTDTGSVRCPYCGIEYKLKPGVVIKHGH